MVAQSRTPYYDLSDIVKSCAICGAVRVRKQAKDEAKSFGFATETRIIDFVSVGVFEDIEHNNTDVLDHDPDQGTPFDAYIFRIGPKHVYFAFYKRQSGVWIIKSFHLPQFGDKAPPLFHSPFKLLEGIK